MILLLNFFVSQKQNQIYKVCLVITKEKDPQRLYVILFKVIDSNTFSLKKYKIESRHTISLHIFFVKKILEKRK